MTSTPSTAASSPTSTSLRGRLARASLQQGAGLFVITLLLFITMALLSPFFLTQRNLINLLIASSTIGMMAVFSTMLLISGGLDLSIAANAALTGMIIAQFQEPLGAWGAAALGMVIATLIGLTNGIVVTYIRVNPFIATLAMMSIARGMALVISGGLTVPIMDIEFAVLGEGIVLGLPLPIIVLIVLFVGAYIAMSRTQYGRAMYAIGGNRTASTLAGLPVNRYRVLVYVLSGASAGLAGVFLTSRLYAAAPQAAQGLELTVIAACVLGGTSLAGGKGTILGTVFGVLILAILNNGMTLLSMPSDAQQIVQGIVLLVAVGVDQLRFGGLMRFNRLFMTK